MFMWFEYQTYKCNTLICTQYNNPYVHSTNCPGKILAVKIEQPYLYTVCVGVVRLQQQHTMQQQQHMMNTSKMTAKPRQLSITMISIVTV